MKSNWLNKVLHGLGFLLTGWLQGLLQSMIIFILLILIFCMLLRCIKKPDNTVFNSIATAYNDSKERKSI